MSIFLRWGIPALVTVVGGTAAAIAVAGPTIPAELTARTTAMLSATSGDWASVSFDGRDAHVTGTAATQGEADAVVARISTTHGVRSVTTDIGFADPVSPYPFVATIENGVTAISGGMPDSAARAIVVAQAGQTVVDRTRPMAGNPDRGVWLTAVGYVLTLSSRMDEGEVALADLQLTVSGRARSRLAFDELAELVAEPPRGTRFAYQEILPPLQSPFEWRAEYDGQQLSLSGAVPSDTVAAELTELAGPDATTSMALASGAPEDFATTARLLIQNLVKLKSGNATISDGTSTLTGLPGSPDAVQSVLTAMAPAGTTVQLEVPEIGEYWFSAERKGEDIVLDGFVPDAAFRDGLVAAGGVDADSLEYGRGAPERFGSAVDLVLDALRRMSEGRAEIRGNVVTLEGRAATVADYVALTGQFEEGAPQGLLLATATVRPPVATPFTFTVARSADGAYALSGHVPSEQARQRFAAMLPASPDDSATIADGYPADFEVAAVKALRLLPLLDSGTITYDGANWSLTGAVDSPQKAFAAEQAFAETGLRAAGWTYTVAVPEQAVAAEPPRIEPYVWSAEKGDAGALRLAGYVPAEPIKRSLASRAGSGAVDDTQLALGAPDDFAAAAVAGLDALAAMQDGQLSLSGSDWSLTGTVPDTATRHAIEQALRDAADVSGWHVAIQAEDAAPVVTPFTWSATKAADGRVSLAGYVPTEALRAELSDAAGSGALDRSLVGSGEPEGFAEAAQAAMAALSQLDSGEAAWDGSNWSLSGQPPSAAVAATVTAALPETGWTVALAEPPVAETPEAAPAVAEEPVEVAATEEPASTPAPLPAFRFEGTKVIGGPVEFSGVVPAEPMRRYLAVITGGEPSEQLSIGDGLPTTFIPSAEAGSRALALLADGEFGLAGDTWVFNGRAETEGQKQAALTELARAPGMDTWQANVTLLPPVEVCKDKVGAFATRNAILFDSGSARIAAASQPAIDELSGYLALCPEASVEIEGHTDSDGAEDANLALSVSRAEAVVDALILRGVGPERLYAIGYGESLPVASNDTRAGKQANRRIAFTVSAPQ